MKWRGRRESTNVDDRRGMSGKGMAVGGGLGAIILLVLGLLLGQNPTDLLNGAGSSTQTEAPSGPRPDDELASFAKVVLAETEVVWTKIFADQGYRYEPPTLVLFTNAVRSGCGDANSQVGPFYCPADGKLYLDLSFFQQMQSRFGAKGDFAAAYVIAHEVAHHIQNLLGISDKVQAMRGRVSQTEYNQLSVRLELQADFLAGVWAHHADNMQNIIEEGDIEEALNAASAIGDDNIQKQTQGYVVPDAFTHGSSQQRVYWFRKGYTTGDIDAGDTFNSEI